MDVVCYDWGKPPETNYRWGNIELLNIIAIAYLLIIKLIITHQNTKDIESNNCLKICILYQTADTE